MIDIQPISVSVWNRLVQANVDAVSCGWATPGVFATGVGPLYQPGAPGTLLYVGKSAGTLGRDVGSCNDQEKSGVASREWMLDKENNPSPFWKFVDKIIGSRSHIAWTNVCKMDRRGRTDRRDGEAPPTRRQWSSIADACIAALGDEIGSLSPRVTVFATTGEYYPELGALLQNLKFKRCGLDFDDGYTTCSTSPSGSYVIETRHPQGWNRAPRDRVIDLAQRLISGGKP